MLSKKMKNKRKKASAMIYGIIIIGITSFVLLSLMQFIVSNLKLGFYAEPKEQANQIAEAGIYTYRWYLGHNIEGKTSTQIGTFWNNAIGVDDDEDGDCDDADTSIDNYDSDNDGDIDSNDSDGTEAYVSVYEDGSGDEIGYYSVCVTKPTTYFPSTINISVTGWTKDKPNIKKTVTARLRKPSWSEYAILTNKYSEFDSSSVIYGPIHGNEGFKLDNATINNIVYASVKEYYDGATEDGVNGTATFSVGKMFPVQKIDFQNAISDFESIKSQATADSLYYDDSGYGRYIHLNSDGTMDVSVVTNYNRKTLEYIELGSTNTNVPISGKVIYVENNIWIDGTLGSGKELTIVAHDSRSGYEPNIYLGSDSLEYSDATNSVLGLMAKNNINFIKNSKDDLRIDAALFAMDGGIGWFQPENVGADWSSVSLTKLTIYGSVISNKRISFKYAGSPDYGFMTQDIIFDGNLNKLAPPMFPSGERIEIDRWGE